MFHILGEIDVDGVSLAGHRRRGLLAYLLAHMGVTVSLDRICDDLWEGAPPAGASGTVRTYVSQFRRLDLPMSILSDAGGYGVELDRSLLDATRFDDLVEIARSTASPADRLALLDEALGLWRGPMLSEFRGATWADEAARPLDVARNRIRVDRLELLLELGRRDEALHGLEAAAVADPLDERLAALHALELYRDGRIAPALRRIAAIRRALTEELGVDPGPELADLERRMLDRDPTLGRSTAAPAVDTGRSDVPTGTVTFMFTDIVGSTQLLHRIGDDAYALVLLRHRELIEREVLDRGGHVVGTEGDAVFSVFSDAGAACAAAADAVRSLIAEPWEPGHEIRVRTGLHTGRALVVGDDYTGNAVHLAARVGSIGHAHQIIATDPTVALAPDVTWRDLGMHRLKDVDRTQRIHQMEAEGLPSSFPSLPTARNVPNNLPETVDTFVGRGHDVEAVRAALVDGRLVTLVGPGGVGKTRLAIESARAALGDHPGGVHFVALAGVSVDDAVEPTVRHTMALPDRSDLDLAGAVTAASSGEASVVVLDNCEHVLAGASSLVRALLRDCPTVRVLATSREPLRVHGERIRWVDPLPVSTSDELGAADELFLARAEAATGRPVPVSDFPLVQVLTRSLDGLPLAIELAAARNRGLALVDVVARLDDRFRLLRSGHQDGDARHRTLESVIAWSHELLTPPDRALLDRLAVFGGSFSLAVAEEVCGIDPLDADAVLDGLPRLVDKSLVRRQPDGDGSRYRLLETVRRFGLDRLDASGRRGEIETRVVDWVLRLVDRLERDMRTGRQDASLRFAIGERDVARTALDIVLARRRWHDALRIVASVPIDVPRERVRSIDELVARIGSAHPVTAGRAHLAAANLCVEMGSMESGVQHAAEARHIHDELGDLSGVAWSAFLESFAIWATGDRGRASDVIDEALAAFEQLRDEIGLANASWMRASLVGDPDEADRWGADAERLCRAIDSPTALAHCLEVRVLIGLRRDETAGQSDRLREALATFVGIRHEGCTAHVLGAVAALAVRSGSEPRLVAELLGAADHLRELSGHTYRPWELEGHTAAVEALGARLPREELEDAIDRGREHTFDSATAAAHRLLDAVS